MIRQIAVLGVGGVGGYFGGKLCALRKVDAELQVWFVARGDHLRAIQENGLILSTEQSGELVCKPHLATDDFKRLPPLDLCLVCVKEFDLAQALQNMEPAIKPETIILPLLNGMDVYERVRRVIKNAIVLPACVYVGTHIEKPGKVTQRGGACKILLGPDSQRPEFSAQELINLFARADIKSEWKPDIDSEVWKKFIFISAFGLVTAAHNKTLGEVLANEDLKEYVRDIMSEAADLARRSGVQLPADIVLSALERGKTFPFEARTSFQRDYERPDRADERELFGGAILQLGERLGVNAARTREMMLELNRRKPLNSPTPGFQSAKMAN